MSKITLNSIASLDTILAATTINTNMTTIQTAFDNTLSRDGTSPNQMQSNLDMNSFQIINLPDPVSGTSPLRVQDLNSYVTTTTTSGITVPNPTVVGQVVFFNSTNGLTLGKDTGNFTWDPVNHRLGLGTASPTSTLHIASGNLTLSSGNLTLSAGSATITSGASQALFVNTTNDNAFALNKSGGTNWNYFQFQNATTPKGAFGMDLNNSWFAGIYNPSFNQILTIDTTGLTTFAGNVKITNTGSAQLTVNNTGTFTVVGYLNSNVQKCQTYWDQGSSLFVFNTLVASHIDFLPNNIQTARYTTTGGVIIGNTLTDPGAGNLFVKGHTINSGGGVTVASLPAAAAGNQGARAFVTDANATTFASIVAGGGANKITVYSDGTNWRIG